MHISLQEALDIIESQGRTIESLVKQRDEFREMAIAWGDAATAYTKDPPEIRLDEESTAEVRTFRLPDDDFCG